MATTFIWLVKGDTRPVLQFTCKTDDPIIIDLTSCTVRFVFKKAGASAYKFKRTCTLVNAVSGLCELSFQTGDLDEVGDFNGELEITFPDSSIQTSKLIHFKVREQLG